MGNLNSVLGCGRLYEKPFDHGSIFEAKCSNRERLRNSVNKGSDCVGWYSPDLHLDAWTFEARNAYQPWFRGDSSIECVKFIVRMCSAGPNETSPAFGELPVERLSGEMRADDGNQ
jgi:hypothetical protein